MTKTRPKMPPGPHKTYAIYVKNVFLELGWSEQNVCDNLNIGVGWLKKVKNGYNVDPTYRSRFEQKLKKAWEAFRSTRPACRPLIWPPYVENSDLHKQKLSGIGLEEGHLRIRVPKPDPEFTYRLGNISIPIRHIWRSPEPFGVGQVDAKYNPTLHTDDARYSMDVKSLHESLYKFYCTRHPAPFANGYKDGNLFRLSGCHPFFEEDRLHLTFSLTTFFRYLATNRSIDVAAIRVGVNRWASIRQKYFHKCSSTTALIDSPILSNPLGVHTILISNSSKQKPQRQVIIQRRNDRVASYAGAWGSSSAGYMNGPGPGPGDIDSEAKPSIFATAIRETTRETAYKPLNGFLKLEDFKLLGIAVGWEDLDLNAYGYIVTNLTAKEILNAATMEDEGSRAAIPFSPQQVLNHISREKWEPCGAMAMCEVLNCFFEHNEMRRFGGSVRGKTGRDFLENS